MPALTVTEESIWRQLIAACRRWAEAHGVHNHRQLEAAAARASHTPVPGYGDRARVRMFADLVRQAQAADPRHADQMLQSADACEAALDGVAQLGGRATPRND